jgi:membrane protease subunit HflC
MKGLKVSISILVVFVIFLILGSLFTIREGQHGILLRLGRVVEEAGQVKVLSPGLHIKMPFIESVRLFDTRIQTLDIKSSRIVTKEKMDVLVDYYVKWRIQDLAVYFRATGGNAFRAETLLEQQLNTSLHAQFGKRTISDLDSGGRDDLMSLLRDYAEKQARSLGINVVDVRVKGIEFPTVTSNAVYQRMRADMQEIANRYRADGSAKAEALQAVADAEVSVMLSRALSEGQLLRAKGLEEAASIYAAAFGKDPKFAAFYRSLKAYEASFNSKDDILVLDQSSSFFDYFRHSLINSAPANLRNNDQNKH